jgi:hypothetical protein
VATEPAELGIVGLVGRYEVESAGGGAGVTHELRIGVGASARRAAMVLMQLFRPNVCSNICP